MTSDDYQYLAQEFLNGLTSEERTRLYNDLLALEHVYKMNQHSTYYTFKNLKRAIHRHSERRKRTFCYMNNHNNELVIHQIHEQHFFKNTYCVHVYFNAKEYNYFFIEQLLLLLKGPSMAPLHKLHEMTV